MTGGELRYQSSRGPTEFTADCIASLPLGRVCEMTDCPPCERRQGGVLLRFRTLTTLVDYSLVLARKPAAGAQRFELR